MNTWEIKPVYVTENNLKYWNSLWRIKHPSCFHKNKEEVSDQVHPGVR